MGLLLPGKDEWVAYFRFAVMFVQSGGGGGEAYLLGWRNNGFRSNHNK